MSESTSSNPKAIFVDYTNWRGKRRLRHVEPVGIWFGESPYHEGEQWFCKAIDLETPDKGPKDFALRDVHAWLERPRIHVVAGALHMEQGGERKFLVGRRDGKRSLFPNCWEFPGGKIEEGESLSEAIRREWNEELSVEIQTNGKVLETFSYVELKSDVHLDIDLVAIETLYGKELVAGDSHSELAWKTASEILALPDDEVTPSTKPFANSPRLVSASRLVEIVAPKVATLHPSPCDTATHEPFDPVGDLRKHPKVESVAFHDGYPGQQTGILVVLKDGGELKTEAPSRSSAALMIFAKYKHVLG